MSNNFSNEAWEQYTEWLRKNSHSLFSIFLKYKVYTVAIILSKSSL